MPTATDLVTDLPADFEVFGQAVATSMADLLGGTSGQILAKNSNTDMDFVWVTNDVGDITAVTAGTGISGGGTSGAVTITNSMATAIDAKGDLVAGTGADAFSRLAVGANDLVLTAASGETTGLKWQGAWTSYTPTFTNLTVGNGTLSMGSSPFFTLPITSDSDNQNTLNLFYMEDVGVAGYGGVWVWRDANTVYLATPAVSGTYLGGNSLFTSTVPFTWGTNDFFRGIFVYGAA